MEATPRLLAHPPFGSIFSARSFDRSCLPPSSVPALVVRFGRLRWAVGAGRSHIVLAHPLTYSDERNPTWACERYGEAIVETMTPLIRWGWR